MRILPRALVLTICLFVVGQFSASVRADNLLIGTFTLAHSTQWNGTTLPAGEYRFKLARTQSNANMLVISGEKQTFSVMVFAQSACDSCKDVALKMSVQGDRRVVTSLELPGYHLEFKDSGREAANKEPAANSSAWTEQVSVHMNGN